MERKPVWRWFKIPCDIKDIKDLVVTTNYGPVVKEKIKLFGQYLLIEVDSFTVSIKVQKTDTQDSREFSFEGLFWLALVV